MRKPWLLCAAAIVFAAAISAAEAPSAAAAGNVYYVAQSGGSDSNPGTLASPWATIQKAANTMVAGDTTYIETGTYRETVTPAHSGTNGNPITYAAYNGETVTVSGFDKVNTTWTSYSGNIYKTTYALGLQDDNQVMMNGGWSDLARYPNDTDQNPFTFNGDPIDATHSDYQTIEDSNLPSGATDEYRNAVVLWRAGVQWEMLGAPVDHSGTDTNGKHLTFTAPGASWEDPNTTGGMNPGFNPYADNEFFVAGVLSLLDTTREWYYDSGTTTLYVWAPNNTNLATNPGDATIEAKARELAFDLTGTSYTHIQGIDVNGAGLKITGNYDVVDDMTGTYLEHNDGVGLHTALPAQSGILLAGHDNLIENGNFSYSADMMFDIQGYNNTVDNNYISDVNYNAGFNGGVDIHAGGGAKFFRNTVSTSGLEGLTIEEGVTKPDYVMWNDFSGGLQYAEDDAEVYLSGPSRDLKGSIIAFNVMHDTRSSCVHCFGFYLDSTISGVVFHHNVVYNTDRAVSYGAGDDRVVYNTTAYNMADGLFSEDHSGGAGVETTGNNLLDPSSANFVNAASHDFRLVGGSSAIDTGSTLSPYTDGYAGSAPDQGAYEYGAAASLSSWTAGVGSTIYNDPAALDIPSCQCSPTNLALTATASASSTYSGYSASKVNDGSEDTTVGPSYSWSNTGAVPAWVELDWSSATSFNRIELYTSTGYEISDFELQYWDGSSWVDVANVTRNTADHLTYVFPTVTSTKIRVLGTVGGGGPLQVSFTRVNELEAYNDDNLALDATASASSTYPGYSPSNVNDGSEDTTVGASTSWADYSAVPAWVELDWTSAKTFSRIDLYTSAGYEIYDFYLQYWNGSSWVNIVPEVTGNTDVYLTYNFSPITASKIRVLGESGNIADGPYQDLYTRVNELEAYQ
jgi:hypothetical protein